MSIDFDEGVADALIDAARLADDELRDEGVLRRAASESALDGFEGGYAHLFRVAVSVEAGSRGKLAGVLGNLADQVAEAKLKAAEERQRQQDLADWEDREREREDRRASGDFAESFGAGVDSFFDLMPSESPVVAPTIEATFSAQQRYRTAGAAMPGKSSADPEHLRTFTSQSRASNQRMQAELNAVQTSWAGFSASCTWVPIGSSNFLAGFADLLAENQADVAWIDRVANAFEAAGGGEISNRALDLSATALQAMSDEELLNALAELSEADLRAMFTTASGLRTQLTQMDPLEVNEWWRSLAETGNPGTKYSAQQRLLLETFPETFGNLEGVPFGARDYANQIALESAIATTEAQLSHAVDAERISTLRTQLDALNNITTAMQVPPGSTGLRYLISLTRDQPPLAAISIGDLDTASSVTYAVPGMGTTTQNMTGWSAVAQNLFNMLPRSSAVVSWIGYATPPAPPADFSVFDANRGVAGGSNLALALIGLGAVRQDTMPVLNVLAHSYGSGTAAIALTYTGVEVDNFITLGSAGLPDGIDSADDLNAASVYSGHARNKLPGEPESGDQWAWIGRDFSRDHHVDPMDPDFGSQLFGTDSGGEAGRPVTDHDPLMGNAGQAGYFDIETESLRNSAAIISGRLDEVTPYVPLGLTDVQQAIQDGLAHGR